MSQYPHPCCRCGFCCLVKQCPISMVMFGERASCPSLFFAGQEAVCTLPAQVPFGDGCCILARCYSNGNCYSFASLDKEVKISIAQSLKDKKFHLKKEGGNSYEKEC